MPDDDVPWAVDVQDAVVAAASGPRIALWAEQRRSLIVTDAARRNIVLMALADDDDQWLYATWIRILSGRVSLLLVISNRARIHWWVFNETIPTRVLHGMMSLLTEVERGCGEQMFRNVAACEHRDAQDGSHSVLAIAWIDGALKGVWQSAVQLDLSSEKETLSGRPCRDARLVHKFDFVGEPSLYAIQGGFLLKSFSSIWYISAACGSLHYRAERIHEIDFNVEMTVFLCVHSITKRIIMLHAMKDAPHTWTIVLLNSRDVRKPESWSQLNTNGLAIDPAQIVVAWFDQVIAMLDLSSMRAHVFTYAPPHSVRLCSLDADAFQEEVALADSIECVADEYGTAHFNGSFSSLRLRPVPHYVQKTLAFIMDSSKPYAERFAMQVACAYGPFVARDHSIKCALKHLEAGGSANTFRAINVLAPISNPHTVHKMQALAGILSGDYSGTLTFLHSLGGLDALLKSDNSSLSLDGRVLPGRPESLFFIVCGALYLHFPRHLPRFVRSAYSQAQVTSDQNPVLNIVYYVEKFVKQRKGFVPLTRELERIHATADLHDFDERPSRAIRLILESRALSDSEEQALSRALEAFSAPVASSEECREVFEVLLDHWLRYPDSKFCFKAASLNQLDKSWNLWFLKPSDFRIVDFHERVDTASSAGVSLDVDKLIGAYRSFMENPNNLNVI